MMNDSVREELEVKAFLPVKPATPPERVKPAPVMPPSKPIKLSEPKPLVLKRITTELPPLSAVETAPFAAPQAAPPAATTTVVTVNKAEPPVPPVLVEFQSKNAALPDWRLKMQNAARQRLENHQPEKGAETIQTPHRAQPIISGANALKVDVIEDTEPIVYKNATVSKALKRIEESRRQFFVADQAEVSEEMPAQPAQNKNYPFHIAARTNEPTVKTPEKATINILPKPKLAAVLPPRTADGDLDTNKLPKLEVKPAQTAADFEQPLTFAMPAEITAPEQTFAAETETEVSSVSAFEASEELLEDAISETVETEEVDDLAPFVMRFNAGIFDLLIGSFIGLVLLAPFMISGGSWFSFTGFLAFAAVTCVVMFVYMTTAVGMFGKTIGMRMFSLELIDIEANDYPTFHQAAVNSSVYLLSLVCGGIGFLTVPFTEEKRAVHDIVSGTIVVKEEE